jgi:hypothetical protein
MDKTVYINGKFLSQKMSGVQRYASEICRQLDSNVTIVAAGDQQNSEVYKLEKPLNLLAAKPGSPGSRSSCP